MSRTQKFAIIGCFFQLLGIFIGWSGTYSFASLVISLHAIFQIILLAFEKEINQ